MQYKSATPPKFNQGSNAWTIKKNKACLKLYRHFFTIRLCHRIQIFFHYLLFAIRYQ